MSIFSSEKKLSPEIVGELRHISRLIKEQSFLMHVVMKNSYHVHKGQAWLHTQQGVVQVLKQYQSDFIGSIAPKYGFKSGTPVTIDLEKGTIREKKSAEDKAVEVPEDLGNEAKPE